MVRDISWFAVEAKNPSEWLLEQDLTVQKQQEKLIVSRSLVLALAVPSDVRRCVGVSVL
jgi:hypothetical protein